MSTSTSPHRYAVPQQRMPALWRVLTGTILELRGSHACSWWLALSASQWSSCTELANLIKLRSWCVPEGQDALRLLLDEGLSPTRLIGSLEGLVQQELLSRSEANRIERHILDRCNSQGGWV